MTTIRLRAAALALAAAVALPALAAPALAELREPEVYMDFQGVAIRGYDTVAYFTESRAVKGEAAYSFDWNGAVWYFTSAEHRDMFAADPERYAPQFGGYCAWGVYRDKLVRSNPEIFEIVDGRLYLNLNDEVQTKWEAARGGAIPVANENWPGVLVIAE